MNKILFLGGIALLLVKGTSLSSPSITGQKGFYRVLAADNESRGTLSFNFHLRASYVARDTVFAWAPSEIKLHPAPDTLPDSLFTDSVDVSDYYGDGDFNFSATYDIIDYITVGVGGVLHGDAIDTDNDELLNRRYSHPYRNYLGWLNRRSINIGDLGAGAKFSYPIIKPKEPEDLKLSLGLYPFFTFPTGTPPASGFPNSADMNRQGLLKKKGAVLTNSGGVFRFFTTNETDYGAIFLSSLKTSGESPVSLHGNVGYNIHNYFQGNDSLESKIANQLLLGFGAGVLMGNFAPFLEVSTKQWIHDDKDIFGANPVILSPGLRFSTMGEKGSFNFDLGADFRVSKENEILPDTTFYVTTGWGAAPTWSLHLGFSVNYDMIVPPKAPPAGLIVGIVKDVETDEYLGATISIPELPDTIFTSITSDPATGKYEISIPPSVVRVRAEKEGYETFQKPAVVKAGETVVLDFELKKKVIPRGKMTGKVTDRITSNPIGATLSFPGTNIVSTASDPATGIYSSEIEPGTYTVTISAEGYISQAAPVVIERDKTSRYDFELLPKGGKLSLRGVNFEFNKATIKPESYPILNQGVELLRKNPRVKVEIQGHTDSVGSDAYNLKLSDRRALSVMNYLIQQGIESWRLSFKGFGESMPVASNKTDEGRAMNRRIDFLILGE